MRLAARTKKLESVLRQRLPRRGHDSDEAKHFVTAEFLEEAAALGCERHVEPGEVGKITVQEWLRRLSVDELLRLEKAAREAASKSGEAVHGVNGEDLLERTSEAAK